MVALKAVELIVSGEVQGVGYRGFVTRIARKLKLVGFAENIEDGTVRIHCKGEAANVDKFKELITVKNPVQASLIEVERIDEKALEDVAGKGFKEKLGDLGEEMAQGFATGNAYLSNGFNKMGEKIDTGFGKLDNNFETLGNKIDYIGAETKSGFSKMDTNFQELNVKYGKISTTMGRIDKNIEKIATKKKGIFD